MGHARHDRGRRPPGSLHSGRYTVFAFVRDPNGTVTLPDVRAAPTTAVETIHGSPLPWKEVPSGIEVELMAAQPGPEPVVIVLHRVDAQPVAVD